MKVSVTNKGEGYVEAKLEAETTAEAMILSMVGMNTVEGVPLELSSRKEWVKGAEKLMTRINCSGFSLEAHNIVS